MKKVKEAMGELFGGQVTITKKELWLLGALCFFIGALYGFSRHKKPAKRGLVIGSYNGNVYGNKCDCEGVCDCEECCK